MYPYQKLGNDKSIRLIHLEPGRATEPIRCNLVHTSLLKNPVYEALSYTWGTNDDSETIFCDNVPFRVTRNLFAALIRFRDAKKTKSLWVDAICINQNDNNEKAGQIYLMREIYSQAQRGLIWLGCKQIEDKQAFAVLQKLDDFIHWYRGKITVAPSQTQGRSLPLHIPAVATKFRDMNVSPREWSCLNKFFQRPWFNRVWVIQEAVIVADNPLPTVVVCGDQELSWNTLANVAEGIVSLGLFFMFGSGSLRSLGHVALCLMERLRRSRKHNATNLLLTMLDSTREACATNPRDKIFGLCGLIPYAEANNVLLLPSYNKSCAEVYTHAATYILKKHNSLSLLQHIPWTLPQYGGHGGISGLPSWVPDWSKRHPFQPLQSKAYSAGGESEPRFRFSGNGTVLSIKGRVLDPINTLMGLEIITQDPKEKHTEDLMTRLKLCHNYKRKWYRFCASACWSLCGRPIQEDIPLPSNQDVYPTGETLQEAFWRTLLCNNDMQRSKVSSEYGAHWSIVHRWYCNSGNIVGNPPSMEEITGMMLFEEPMDLFAEGRRFCTTFNGRMGWVPQRAQIGDLVCIFQGCSVPFVIRKAFFKNARLPFLVGPAIPYYEVVGECYIHGYMEGEAIKGQECNLEEIRLR